MKLNFVLLAVGMVKAQDNGDEMDLECYSKVDCKVIDLMRDAASSGKLSKCKRMKSSEDVTKCVIEEFGLNKDQLDIALKLAPYSKKCTPIVDTETKTCAAGCTKQMDAGDCLESCVLPPKAKAEECLENLAGMSTKNATKNAKCMMGCYKSTFAEIFQCQYECRKDVIDALVSKSSSQNSSSSGSQSSSYLITQVGSLAKITLSILIASLFI